jgi:hypothetical protein
VDASVSSSVRFRSILAVVCVAFFPLELAAQQIQLRGVALDEQTREPVVGAAINLIDASGNRLLATLSDAQGRFLLTAPEPGRYRVRGERLGYFTSQTGEFSSSAVSGLIELRMSPRPVRLDSIMVSAKSDARPVRAGEQLIHGRVIDDDTHATVPGATIELYSKGKRVSTTIADAYGLFRIITPLAGAYTLRAARIGYKTADSPELKLILGDTIRLDFYLSAKAVLLAPIVVTGSAREWLTRREQTGMEDFNGRLKRFGNSKFGDFLTRDSLAAFEQDRYALKTIIQSHFFRKPGNCRDNIDVFVNGAPFLFELPQNKELTYQEKISRLAQALDDAFSTGSLEAMELYTAPTIPGEFSGASPIRRDAKQGGFGMSCNVIALWTRR